MSPITDSPTSTTKKGKKSVNWRYDPGILARLSAVSEMILTGATAWQVAEAMKTSLATAKRDIARVKTLWLERFSGEVDFRRNESLAQYELIKMRAWDGYRKKSNPRYLSIVIDAQSRIDDITGTKSAQRHIVVTKTVDELTDAELTQFIAGQLTQEKKQQMTNST